MPAPPEVIQQTIDTFREATRWNRTIAARRGNIVIPDPAGTDEIMVTADLHGNRLNMNRILEIADLDAHPRRQLVMQEVCHGGPPYPNGNGGCMSHTMLEDMARLKVRWPDRFHFLLSNHELAEAIDFPIIKSGRLLNLFFRAGLRRMYGEATDQVRQAYVEFILSCPIGLLFESRHVFISHSAPIDCDREPFNPALLDRPFVHADFIEAGELFRLLWGRDWRQANAEAFTDALGVAVSIHGHEPCKQGYQRPNDRQIILDCTGERARYLIVPYREKPTFDQLCGKIERLYPLAGKEN